METKVDTSNLPKCLIGPLNIIAKDLQMTDYSVHLDGGSNHGDGFMADLIGITLKGNCLNGHTKNYELPLICKLIPASATRREAFSSVFLFEREVYFYKTILPIFLNFLKEKKIYVEDEFSMYPKCLAALSDPIDDQYLIIMENLKAANYAMWDKTVPIDFDTVAFIFSELGKFHAISFAIRDQKRDIFDKYFQIREVFFEIFKGNGLAESMISASIQQTIDVLDDSREIEIMKYVSMNYEKLIKEYLKENAAGRFSVLNHGDLWNNNIMLSFEPKRKICFVDFQLVRLVSPAIDISNYLCTSTNSEIHQRSNELLRIYHDSLSTFLSKLGSDPQKWFTFDDLQNQLRQFGKYGLIFASFLNGVMVASGNDIIDMNSIKEDSDTAGPINFNENTKILYKKRMSSAIQLVRRNGWIEDRQSL